MKTDQRDRESSFDQSPPTLEQEASEAFIERLYGSWEPKDQAALESRLQRDPGYADAYRRVQKSWSSLDHLAETPEVLAYREEAITVARQATAQRRLKAGPHRRNRWLATAASFAAALVGIAAWQLSPYAYRPGEYRTGIGEQRMLELADHSRIVLDSATRIRVRLSDDSRVVELTEGQAQFNVAKDPTRPFKVQVGGETIVALGTVFTVDFTRQQVHVAMMEGRVAVIPRDSRTAPRDVTAAPSSATASAIHPEGGGAVELSAGEELRVTRDGRRTLTSKADLEAATAWRDGKVIFRDEPLSEAVRRLSRYSSLQIDIEDDALAAMHISGVFDAGDTQGFINGIQRYLPVTVEYTHSGTARMKMTSPAAR